MSLPENISDAFASCVVFQKALAQIARGHAGGGSPLSRGEAQEVARRALLARGRSWASDPLTADELRAGMATAQVSPQSEPGEHP